MFSPFVQFLLSLVAGLATFLHRQAPSVLLLIHCGERGHAGRCPPWGSVRFSGVSGQIPLAPYATCNCESELKVQQEHFISLINI